MPTLVIYLAHDSSSPEEGYLVYFGPEWLLVSGASVPGMKPRRISLPLGVHAAVFRAEISTILHPYFLRQSCSFVSP